MDIAKTIAALVISGLLTIFVCAKDQEKHGSKNTKHSGKEVRAKESKAPEKSESKSKTTVKATFTTQEREAIKAYAKTFEGGGDKKSKGLPPGLQKKVARGGDLPPGWQKKLATGQIMPEEVVKIATPLPKELIVKLPPQPIGTITVAVDSRIVRMMEKTREILDILELP